MTTTNLIMKYDRCTAGATRSNSFAMCLGSFLPRKAIDLVVLEFAQNDEVENVHGLEEGASAVIVLIVVLHERTPPHPLMQKVERSLNCS